MIKFEDKRQLILDGFDAYGVRHRLRAGHFHPSTGVSKSLLGCHMDFLQKLRPWFGHQAHMHVRLKCPFDSPECVSQAPVPQGTGCGYEVDSWFLPPPPKSGKAVAKKKRACASTKVRPIA